jgi:carbonic anhydrase
MNDKEKLFLSNQAWAQEKLDVDSNYFTELARDQNPDYLWIGCSDSRVPANEIIGAQPGELFVHRNIANLVVHTDLNLLSVLDYAVTHLKVKHIILCGHTGCGGVRAAMTHRNFDLLNKWLRNLKEVYYHHQEEIDAIENEDERVDRFVEINVLEQIMNLAKTSVIQKSWQKNQFPQLHGWVYNMNTGLLKSITEMGHESEIHPIYKFDTFD